MNVKSIKLKAYQLAILGLLLCPLIALAESDAQGKDIYPQVVQLPASQMTSPNATDGLMSSGSKYAPQAEENSASEQGQYGPAHAPGGPNRTPVNPLDPHLNPIGDALWPLALLALAFCGVIYFRRKRKAKS